MISSLLLVATLKPRVVLKPTRDPVSAVFHPYRKQTAKAIWVDHRDTGVRVPNWADDARWALDLVPIREFSNRKRDLGGEFGEVYRGAMNGIYHHPFVKAKGEKFIVLPRTPGDNNAYAVGLDERGRLLAVDDPPLTNMSHVRHACVWSGGAWIDLGPAESAHFEHDGSVVGSFPTDRTGHPLEPLDYGGRDGFRVRFRWKDGKRTESKPYQA